MQSENCISSFVRRMRLELTRPCDHYPLKVACIPISPPAQGLFEKLSGKRDSNPRPQPWQGCALPTELFPQISLKFAGRLEAPRYNQCLLLRSAFTNVPHFCQNRVWVEMDSNHRRRKPADLQSAPFGHSGIYPVH